MSMIAYKSDKTVAKLEKQLFEVKKKLAAARKKSGKRIVEDYILKDTHGQPVRLSQLFHGKQELILIHNMGNHCSHCTMWAEGFDGLLPYLEDRAGFVVTSPDPPEVLSGFAKTRGWRFRLASTSGSSFKRDFGFEGAHGPLPGVSTFAKDAKGRIVHVASAGFGPGDEYCATWSLLDLLPKGADGWKPKYQKLGR
ncbi:MAG: DUF899 family protein [Elusimicrobia bacterium]|nr:DUF899 family protein [Elusimicrobiota bacterium]